MHDRAPHLRSVEDSQDDVAPDPLTSQQVQTRLDVLVRHATRFRDATGTSHEVWVERVDASYCRIVPLEHRTLKVPALHDRMRPAVRDKLLRAWDQQIRRYVHEEQRFPLELEEPWIYALPEPFRGECIRELSQRLGCYGAQIREPGTGGDHAAWGDFLSRSGEIASLMGKVLADGRMDENDRELLRELVPQIRAGQAALETLSRRAEEELR